MRGSRWCAGVLFGGLFNTTRAGGVTGTAVFGTDYLTLAPARHQAVHALATVYLVLAATALVAAFLAGLSIRGRRADG